MSYGNSVSDRRHINHDYDHNTSFHNYHDDPPGDDHYQTTSPNDNHGAAATSPNDCRTSELHSSHQWWELLRAGRVLP